jgi:hypothetical protein
LVRHELVGDDVIIVVKLYTANVGSSHSAFEIEALFPSSENVYSLIVLKHVFVFVDM